MDTATTTVPQQEDCLPQNRDKPVSITSLSEDGRLHAMSREMNDLTAIDKQTEIIEMILKLQTDLIEKDSECERLKIKLDESNRTAAALGQELDECKLTMFQNNEDSKKVHEEVQKNRKLEEDYVKLMSNYLNLSERYDQHRQDIYETFMVKTNAINNYESSMSRDAIKHELDQCKVELASRQADASILTAKLRSMEEDHGVKEKCITELKKSLEDAKVTHKHEITVLEEYIQCLKNTITSYEKTLATYVDEFGESEERLPAVIDNNEP